MVLVDEDKLMAVTLKEYKWVFETGNDPDVTEINQAGAEGWEVIFGGSRIAGSGQTQWGYLMQRSAGQTTETDVLVGTFTVGTSDNRITMPNHGLLSTDMVRFALGTEPENVLPAPLVEGVYYFLVGVRGNDFQVSLISGGLPVDLTSQGVGGTNEVWRKA
jgi:hypothetical protein